MFSNALLSQNGGRYSADGAMIARALTLAAGLALVGTGGRGAAGPDHPQETKAEHDTWAQGAERFPAITRPTVESRCVAGCVRYRRSDWGANPDGTMTSSVAPTSCAEWTYLSDGSSVTYHPADDPDEQRRIVGRWSIAVNSRAREATLLRGQHAPAPEGIDELLIGCEGLDERPESETLREELEVARVLAVEQTSDIVTLRYSLPGEANGWVHELEWTNEQTPRIRCRTLEIPEPSRAAENPPVARVIRAEVIEWEVSKAGVVPKIVERSVRTAQGGRRGPLVARSRFEVLERRSELTDAERARVGRVAVEAGWMVTRQDMSLSAVIGETEFEFAGRRYAAAAPVRLVDLEQPEKLLKEATCLD